MLTDKSGVSVNSETTACRSGKTATDGCGGSCKCKSGAKDAATASSWVDQTSVQAIKCDQCNTLLPLQSEEYLIFEGQVISHEGVRLLGMTGVRIAVCKRCVEKILCPKKYTGIR
jgi:hypothetical protein